MSGCIPCENVAFLSKKFHLLVEQMVICGQARKHDERCAVGPDLVCPVMDIAGICFVNFFFHFYSPPLLVVKAGEEFLFFCTRLPLPWEYFITVK